MTLHDTTPAPAAPRHRGASFAVSVITTVVGACVALGTLAGTGASAVGSMGETGADTVSYDSPTDTLTDLDIDVAGGALTVQYGDVEIAQLDADTSGRKGWTFERHGDTLRVASPSDSFEDWGTGSTATLTLPRLLEGTAIDADIRVTGGSLDLTGDFGALSVEVAGGSATTDGAAIDADLTVTGGSATVDVTDASTVAFEVAGGQLTARVNGTTPSSTDVEVTAGSADVTLPDDEYRVRVDDGAGTVDNGLRTSSSAIAEVDVQATMGSVRLR